MPNAVEVKKFHKNGNPSWQVSVSAVVVAVVALVVLAWLTGIDTSALIPALFRK
jgi:small-conductance mechanosensitive channel